MILWIAETNDQQCYNLISQTKADLLIQIEGLARKAESVEVFKIEISTSNVFSLIVSLTGEGGGRNQYMGSIKQSYNTYSRSNGKLGLLRLTLPSVSDRVIKEENEKRGFNMVSLSGLTPPKTSAIKVI